MCVLILDEHTHNQTGLILTLFYFFLFTPTHKTAIPSQNEKTKYLIIMVNIIVISKHIGVSLVALLLLAVLALSSSSSVVVVVDAADAAVVRRTTNSRGIRGISSSTTAATEAEATATATTIMMNTNNNNRNLKKKTRGEKKKIAFPKKLTGTIPAQLFKTVTTNTVSSTSTNSNNVLAATTGGTDSVVVISSRVDESAKAAAATKMSYTLNDWVSTCGVMSRSIDICASNDPNNVCKNCLKALSTTTSGQNVNSAGVVTCSKSEFCGFCSPEELRPFFACGLQLEGITSTTTTTTSITGGGGSDVVVSTATTSTITLEEEEEPAAVDVAAVVTATTTSTTNPEPSTMVATPEAEPITPLWDLKNCPSLYPRSGNDCVIIDGYDYKKCFYYEYGPDVVCQCSDASPIWICTGTIIRNPGVLQEEEPEEEDDEEVVVVVVGEQDDLEVTVEVIKEEEVVIIVVEQEDLEVTVELFDEEVIVTVDDIEDDNNSTAMISEEEEDDVEVGIDAEINTALLNEEMELLCPTDIPLPGDECVLDGFDTISCCYTDPKPIPGTLGTILCTCTDDFGEEEFTCMRGSLSLCTV